MQNFFDILQTSLIQNLFDIPITNVFDILVLQTSLIYLLQTSSKEDDLFTITPQNKLERDSKLVRTI